MLGARGAARSCGNERGVPAVARPQTVPVAARVLAGADNSSPPPHLALDLHGEHGEQQHLDGGAGRVPEGAADAILVGDVGGLEQRGSPRPLGHNVAGGEAGLDGAPRGGELLAGVAGAAVAVVEEHQHRRQQREQRAKRLWRAGEGGGAGEAGASVGGA